MKITVFSSPGCGQCTVVKNKLKKSNIPFEEVLCDSLENTKRAEVYGIRHAPALVYEENGESEILVSLPKIIEFIDKHK